MELKVWVDGVARVVCGLTLNTSCKDVVIALAQSLGQTGRYLLILRLGETEQQLEAGDCPLQHLARLGQLAADVRFTLRRTGPSHEGSSSPPGGTQKAPKEEVFRLVLQQQRRLRDLRGLLHSLEAEAEAEADAPPGTEQLEEQLRRNEAELLLGERWAQELQVETDREREMLRRLRQIHASLEAHGGQMLELQRRSERLRRDLSLPPDPAPDQEEVLRPLQTELRHRLQQAQELDATLSQTEGALQTAEQRLQDRRRMAEELNKELRQWKLQQFIQQTGGPQPEQIGPPQTTNLYLINAAIVEPEVVGCCTTR